MFSKPAPTTPQHHGFLVSHSLIILLVCVHFCVQSLVCIFLHLLSAHSPFPPLSVSPSLSPPSFTDLEVWKCSFTLPLLHKLLFYLFANAFSNEIKEQAAFAVTTYSMCFLAGFSVDLQVPNQCRRKMEIACSESSFPVNCWNCAVCLLTGVTESLPFLPTTPSHCFSLFLSFPLFPCLFLCLYCSFSLFSLFSFSLSSR